MPVTQGSGNPNWTWDETLLALDLLYRHDRAVGKEHEDVHNLSELLRATSSHPQENRKPNFRNPDGVALKLQNLLSAIDPQRGLSSSRTDRQIVAAYPKAKAGELRIIADLLRQGLSNIDADGEREAAGEVTFKEGRFITSRHRARDSRLRKALLRTKADADLQCEICSFQPPAFERVIRESFLEAHHIVPLAKAEAEVRTKVIDAALLCACCHRFIHRLIAQSGDWIAIAEARAVLLSAR